MVAQLLSGSEVAKIRRESLKEKATKLEESNLATPSLAVILVGDDPASQIYTAKKTKACEQVGFHSHPYHLPASTKENELIALIEELNQAEHIDGILVQLPLPAHINANHIIEKIRVEKDVDGFHPYNLGRLAQRRPLLRPCTPYGIMNLLTHYKIDVKGLDATVVGTSNIVGRPMVLELLLAGATVTNCHRFTKTLEKHVREADVLISATGKLDLISPAWIKPGAIVIDVGITRLDDGSLRGDIDFAQAQEIAGWITPVPGGVGPMTVTTLLENTLQAAQLLRGGK